MTCPANTYIQLSAGTSYISTSPILAGNWFKWFANQTGGNYVVGLVINDQSGHVQQITACSGTCVTGGGTPAWNHAGGTTTDNNITWQDKGATGTAFAANGNIELRGMGSNSTFLIPTGQCSANGFGGFICASSTENVGPNTATNTANVTGTLTQGSTTITLSNVSNLYVGHMLNIDQLEDTNDIGSYLIDASTSTGPFTAPGSAGPYATQGENGIRTGRGQAQVVVITSCDGNSTPLHVCASGTNVGITPGLLAPQWNAGKSPGAWWASDQCQDVGVQNLSIDDSNGGDGPGNGGGIVFFNCRDVWVTGVRTIHTSRSAVLFQWSTNGIVRNSYFYDARYAIPNGQTSYGVECSGSANLLIENNIFQAIASPMLMNGGCTNIIRGYNFMTLSTYGLGGAGYEISSIAYHGIGNDFILDEGNIAGSAVADAIHGSHNMDTIFRGFHSGVYPACWASGATLAVSTFQQCTNGNINPLSLYSFSRYFNAVASVWGDPIATNGYQNSGSNPIFATGIGDSGSGPSVVPAEAVTTNTFLKWDNWDYSHGSTQCNNSEIPTADAFYPNSVPTLGCGGGALPASFYYTSQPSWWPSGKPWPLIGPDVSGGNVLYCQSGANVRAYITSTGQCPGGTTVSIGAGHVNSNGAMDCFLNVMGGNPQGINTTPLAFDASACYSASNPSPAPAPAIGLFAKVNGNHRISGVHR